MGVLPLVGAWITTGEKPTAFAITPPAKAGKTFYLEAESEEARDQWLAALQEHAAVNLQLEGDQFATIAFDTPSVDPTELVANLVTMSSSLGVTALLGKSDSEMSAYFAACREQMRDCPFHNWFHAADVTQMMYTLLRTTGIAVLLSPMQLVAVFLAAPAHDLDHRGFSNAYEKNEKTDIGVKYPEAPLETHHATKALETLERVGLLSSLSPQSKDVVLECVRSCIMSTDMGHHSDIMQEFADSEAELMSASHKASDFFSHGKKGMLLLGMLLKASDISNPSRPIGVADRWNLLVYEEFYAEGDVDAEAGRDVNPLHNRASNSIPRSTVGFIDFVVAKIFTELSKFARAAADGPDAPGCRPEGFEDVLAALESNKAVHAGRAAA